MVDHFKVAHLVGHGGMGEVYLARDMQLGRKVALKIVRPEMIGDEQAVERFLFEARVTARFSHPHIVTIYAVGSHAGNPYVALEYLEGRSLRGRMAEGAFGPLEAARIAKEIAEALVEAHRNGVLHRDLKPENVQLPRDGRLRVLDFGLAKAVSTDEPATLDTIRTAALAAKSLARFETRGSGPMGTPQYMAPEQWNEGACTGATDVWALGVTLFEMLEGRRPFAGTTVSALCAAVCTDEAAPKVVAAGVPAELAAIVARCLAKKSEERPTAAEIAEALDDVLSRGRGRVRAEESPFRGLLPFTERHAGSFFGRDEEVAAFVERLRDEPIVAVVGPSGAGKSSFVQAGAVPRLREQGRWIVFSLRPGPSPFEALASRLARGESDGTRTSIPTRTSLGAGAEAALAAELRDAPGRLALKLGELAEREGVRVLLLVDQLEELYALVSDEALRRAFIEALCAAADDPAGPVRVVLTLRDDFLGKVAAGEIARRTLSRVTALRSPGPEALREIAARPLADAGYAYEDPDLPAAMAAAVQGEPASLPLLQFALSALWEARDREKKLIPKAAYAALGGVEGALARHADGILAGLSPEDVRSAREIFLRLVTPEGTRRAVARYELLAGLPGGVAAVVDILVRERALVSRKGRGEGDAEIELVHESLIRKWDRLARWMDESREEIVFLAEARQAAVLWAKRGRAADALWQGDQLRDGERMAGRLPTLPDDVRRFLDAGRALSSRRAKRKRLALALGFAFLSAVGVVLFFMNREAVRQRWVAEARRTEALQQQAESLLTSARAALAQGAPSTERAMLRSALEIQDLPSGRALWDAARRNPLDWQIDLGTTVSVGAIFPNGETVAVGGTDGRVYLIDLRSGRVIRTLRGHKGPVKAVAIAPDGRSLASAAENDSVRLLDLDNGETRAFPLSGRCWSVRFLGGGDRLAWLDSLDIHVWNPTTNEHALFPRIDKQIGSLAASPGGRLIAVGNDNKVVLFDTASRRIVRTLEGHRGRVRALAFDPTGKRLATASLEDATILVWRTDTWQQEARIPGIPIYYPSALGFSPDGTFLVAGNESGRLSVYSVPDGFRQTASWEHLGIISSVAFSPNGMSIISTASYSRTVQSWRWRQEREDSAKHAAWPPQCYAEPSPDGTAIAAAGDAGGTAIFDVRSGRYRSCFPNAGNGIPYALAMSPDGRRLATGTNSESAIRVYDFSTHEELYRSPLPLGVRPLNLAFSPNSSALVAAGSHGILRVWDAASGNLVRDLVTDASDQYSASFSPDGRLFAAAGESGAIRVFDTHTWDKLREIDTSDFLRGAVFCPGAETIVTNGKFPFVRIWDLRKKTSRVVETGTPTMFPLACHPDGRRIGITSSSATARVIDLTTGETVDLVGHASNEDVNRMRFTPDGVLAVTSCDDGTIRTWYVNDGRPFWRAPLLIEKTVTLFTHEGWIDVRAEDAKLRPSATAWEKAVEERAREAYTSKDTSYLCIRTHDGRVAIWDMAADRQLAEVPLPDLARVAAFPGGCLALAGDKAFSIDLGGKTRQLADKATAISWDEDAILVAADREARLFSKEGKQLRAWKTDVGPTALKRVGPWLAVGYGDGAAEMQSIEGTAGAPVLEDRLPTPVTLIAEGPAGTLLVGHVNGGLGLWDVKSGARLDARYVHGPVRHLLFDGANLRAISELGDRTELDLSVYARPYCDLLREVWKEVPVVWEGGKPVRREPPKDHPCSTR